MVRRVAAAEAPVLLTGESGTGKELVARLIHRFSPRAKRPFVALNCATLQDTLVEAELFGYERGAFTGANQSRAGLIEAAEGGLLFLDELADLSLPAQAKLLRVLQEAAYRRLGSSEERHCDIRLVAATNKSLPDAIEAGRFRQDLYFRLNILEIEMPPLRQRREDIPLLVAHWYGSRGQEMPEEISSREVQEILSNYRWPGNVRELFNVLERVAILSGPGRFDRKVLEHYVTMARGGGPDLLPDRLEDLEMLHIRQVLDRCRGNKTQAARILGISLKTLYNKLNRVKGGEEG
jgi:transcriptional regulator with PAS, ATPase and Fis domain